MDGTDVLRTELLQVFGNIPAVLDDGLELIEDTDSFTFNLLQQFQVAFCI